ncbi:microtubule-associated protein Jupiter isoform X2 [Lucilia cuprina]|uniref:microtubule-associated protein Jupiter isoform X2 n=1 Tax=Lucilia cuprina TaxID=7375 RepID=UPI001F06FC26|nr:microtubule-associated protein Jupiter isoform X2 [Lucilia cuprina]
MAAYAAFKHVELYNVGKTKKRVLRPPGGGTSDIFGGDLPQTPRSVKNHMQSNIFSCEKDSIKNNGDQPRRAQKNVDSYQRLFGEPERPVTPAKNHMKSNIPFGAKNEAAQALIMNGNGNGHYNGKSGSVSSASSSVSSSTENLKMNGFSKTVYLRKMSNPTTPRNDIDSQHHLEMDENVKPINNKCQEFRNDLDKIDKTNSLTPQDSSRSGGDNGAGDIKSCQTVKTSACNSHEPYSLTTNSSCNPQESLVQCLDVKKMSRASASAAAAARNPITGMGLNGDGVGGLKPLKPKCRKDGNPVTGEGYKSNDFNHTPSLNGANQVINKNRIPPGGFSSGLW